MNLPDRYELLGDSMDGGMSSVFPYRDRTLERKVALKVIPPGPNRRRINDELLALFKLRSKHVVQVYDVLTDATSLGIVQEFIEGSDLFCDNIAPGDGNSYLRMIWQIASGISEVHAAGLIHRDIKPNNMKVDHEGILKIYDFGLARDDGPNAATVGFVGTHGFAAPELYRTSATFTKAVDTYAFGATALYFGARNLPDEMLQKPPVALTHNYFSALPFAIDPSLCELLHRCLAFDPSDRPDMTAVRTEIERHLLFDKHRALVIFKGNASYLDSQNRSVKLKYGNIGEVSISYDGFSFAVTAVSGEIFVNNAPARVGRRLPGACVLTMGAHERGRDREYVTFDLSNPGIVL